GLRAPPEGDDRRMLEEEEHVLRLAAGDPVERQAALPVQRLAIGNASRFHDLEDAIGHDPVPALRAPFPRTAQRLPATPKPAAATARRISPAVPSSWRAGIANRKATNRAPKTASTATTPRCHMFSTPWLRRHPNRAAMAIPATRLATSRLPEASSRSSAPTPAS